EVVEETTEVAVAGEIADLRDRELVAEQRLGSHQHQWLAEIAPHLPPEDVEVICRSRAVRDLEIVFGTELQIALEPRRAVFGSLPLEGVRKQHDKVTGEQPLGLDRGEVLGDVT